MIRTTREASLFGLWRDASVLEALVKPEHLTTARYEPVTRNALGSGVVELLFERAEQSCVVSAIRLDPNSLITRERSPFVWPSEMASLLDADRFVAMETLLTPWLRSLARGRPMAQESIRRFAHSERFDRAREAELLGATPWALVLRRMAPFIYAQRFAAGSRIFIDCADEALAHAVLADLAAAIGHATELPECESGGDRDFARAWYGVRSSQGPSGASDLALLDTYGEAEAPIVIAMSGSGDARSVAIDVPSPAPLDLLFSFDAADAPVISRFAVRAVEPPLRDAPRWGSPKVIGSSTGRIVIAMSAEALAMRDADVEEAQSLIRCLIDEGLTVSIATDVGDPAMAVAELVHIMGGTFEAHTTAFAQAARERGVDYVFDVSPRPASPSGYLENMLVVALRAGSDDAETARYLLAYEERRASGSTVPEPSPEEFALVEKRFAELAAGALAVLASEEDLDGLRALVPPAAAARVLARGIFSSAEPPPAPIGHLVPNAPFAFIHAPIAVRSHALFAALAARNGGVPLVIAGPCYDVEYLQTLRTIAPAALVLTDTDAGVTAAMYRRATIWIDAAPRPRSAAGLVRAVACGALPVLALESPLSGIAGQSAPTFGLTSLEQSAASIGEAMALPDRNERIATLQKQLAPGRNLAVTFRALLAAYAPAATAV